MHCMTVWLLLGCVPVHGGTGRSFRSISQGDRSMSPKLTGTCRTSTVMALFCIKPTATLISDAKRAELLRCLLDTGSSLDLSAVNALLQTPAHCAVQSRSLEVLKVG